MEEERQEEQEQRAMAVQAGARRRLGNYLGWLAQDLVSQRLFVRSSLFFFCCIACSRVCFCGKGAPSACEPKLTVSALFSAERSFWCVVDES